MRIVILGSGGFHPSERRHTAAFLLPERGLLLDAGTAAFRVRDHVATDRLDVLLTHAHLDHIIGLTYLLGLEHDGGAVDVRVHANPATLDAVRGCLLDPRLFPVAPVAGFAELPESSVLPCGLTATTFPLDHPGGSIGIRLEDGDKSIAYVTDTTTPTAATVERIRGVDLLIHEAYFTEPNAELATLTGHATAAQAAEAARAAGVGRMVLVHRDPRSDDDAEALAEATAIFPETRVATDGMTLDV